MKYSLDIDGSDQRVALSIDFYLWTYFFILMHVCTDVRTTAFSAGLCSHSQIALPKINESKRFDFYDGAFIG